MTGGECVAMLARLPMRLPASDQLSVEEAAYSQAVSSRPFAGDFGDEVQLVLGHIVDLYDSEFAVDIAAAAMHSLLTSPVVRNEPWNYWQLSNAVRHGLSIQGLRPSRLVCFHAAFLYCTLQETSRLEGWTEGLVALHVLNRATLKVLASDDEWKDVWDDSLPKVW